jgi:hypothetical protein
MVDMPSPATGPRAHSLRERYQCPSEDLPFPIESTAKDLLGLSVEGRHGLEVTGLRFLESKRLWLTSPADHPFRVEWLWYEPDSPETELARTTPHVAYRVASLEDAMEDYPVIAEPFNVFDEVRVAFVEVDRAPVEFVQALAR